MVQRSAGKRVALLTEAQQIQALVKRQRGRETIVKILDGSKGTLWESRVTFRRIASEATVDESDPLHRRVTEALQLLRSMEDAVEELHKAMEANAFSILGFPSASKSNES